MASANRTLLHEAGEALFGPRWQTEIAKALNVNDRTVRRWAAEPDTVPRGVSADLRRLCDERIQLLTAMRDRLEAAS
jgi:hypothetical protein